MTTFFSPLEQFFILPLFNFLGIPLTNIFINIVVLFTFLILYIVIITNNTWTNTCIIPNRWQFLFESLFVSVSSILQDNLESETKNKFFPIVCTTFFLILSFNIFGLLPYTFTVTSALIIVFAISLMIFFGIHIIAVQINKIKIFSLFFPSGVSVVLSLLLVPIELMSFSFKPISLSLRLFANMMAGHTFLKVLAGFAWSLMTLTGLFSIIHFIPIFLIVVFFFLEFGVAIIQSFVFSILFSIYLNDIFNLH
jgi:ATP synthase subunit 6